MRADSDIFNFGWFLLREPEVASLNIVSKVLLIGEQLRHDHLLRSSGVETGAEQAVHGLEWHALGLGEKEEDENGTKDHEGGEKEVDAVAHGSEHLRSEAGDEEIPELKKRQLLISGLGRTE